MQYINRVAIFLMVFKNACPYYSRNNFSLYVLFGTALIIFFCPKFCCGLERLSKNWLYFGWKTNKKKKSTFRNVRVGTIEWNVIIPMHCPMAGPSCSAGCETPSGTALSTAALRSPGPGTRPPGCVSPWPGSVSELQFALVPWAASRLAWGHFSLGITYRLSWREKVTFSLSYLPTACLCVPTCTQSHLCPWAHTHACRLPIPSSQY